jgi:hypothetical protein
MCNLRMTPMTRPIANLEDGIITGAAAVELKSLLGFGSPGLRLRGLFLDSLPYEIATPRHASHRRSRDEPQGDP